MCYCTACRKKKLDPAAVFVMFLYEDCSRGLDYIWCGLVRSVGVLEASDGVIKLDLMLEKSKSPW